MKRPVKIAAKSVDATADYIRYLGQKIEKYGIRITVVKGFPKPIVDLNIKDGK